MKLSILALFSAAVVGQGVNAHAEGTFGETLKNRFTGRAVYEAKTSDMGAVVLLNEVEEVEESAASGIVPIGQGCNDSCCGSNSNSWFGSNMAPGTGAFGGDSAFAASLGFNQDVFFGNYTTLFAGYAINELVDVTFYSILWHTDFFSQGTLNNGINGTGLWTEFGAGLNFKAMDGALNINPQLGILNGALLSSGGPGNTPVVFDGVVPNLTVSYDDTFLESEFYMGYYVGTRGIAQNDYLHWWYNAGVKPWGDSNDWKSILSTGLHYEMLRQTGPGAATNLYSWIGPYFQVALPNGLGMRYSAGWNVDDGMAAGGNPLGENFYKVNLTYDF